MEHSNRSLEWPRDVARREKQDLKKVLEELVIKYTDARIVRHYELDEKKTCPNINVREYLLNEDIKNYKFQDGLTDEADLAELEDEPRE